MASTQQLLLGEGAGGAEKNYIEDVFSTYLYTGNATARSITNGVDLSTKGGMVWLKSRSNSAYNLLFDTSRGAGKPIISNSTDAQYDTADTQKTLTAFNTDGFSLGTDSGNWGANFNAYTYASWTFRKQPKFYTQGTFTGNGANRTISHDLGSAPGMIIVKRTDTTAPWIVYHRSLGATKYIFLNSTSAASTGSTYWNNTDPTSTVFSLGTEGDVNGSGGTFVYYAFAHDAGGFGLTGTDNVISCGSFVGDDSSDGSKKITLGYEPQWLLVKDTSLSQNWFLVDNMRGFVANGLDNYLIPNLSNAESTLALFSPTSTGFACYNSALNRSTSTYIYIAIRRGPMKVPTDATKVFAVDTDRNATKPGFTSNFPVDFATRLYRLGAANMRNGSRLTGANHLESNTTAAEASDSEMTWDYMTGWGNDTGATSVIVSHMFKRAPSFFDEVCYKGNSTSGLVVSHNLAVVPELVIFKKRDASGGGWPVWTTSVGTGTSFNYLNSTAAVANQGVQVFTASPTSATMTLGSWTGVNNTGAMVAYLFATCAGVSKVGSYTGTGTTLQVDCGFAAGARFVLIKRTDSTGDWYVWDTARGIVSGNDPYLLLNSTAAEVTSTDYIDTYSAGFEISSTAPAAINASGGTFIFLAIA